MSRVFFGVAALSLTVATGCAGESTPDGEGPLRVFVGAAAESADTAENVLVGFVVRDDSYLFFACGDKMDDPTTVWVPAVAEADGDKLSISHAPLVGWQLEAEVDGTQLTGTFVRDGDPERTFKAELIPEGDESGAGLYSDFAGCETGMVVGSDGTAQGSYCTSAVSPGASNARAQVTPLQPVNHGWEVELDQGQLVLLKRATLQTQ